MAAKDTGKKGLLGWLRSQKQAEETGRVPVVRTTPMPVTLDEKLEKEVARRHVDKGEIARGGMGSIRKVTDTNLLRTVAMKVLFPEHRGDVKTMQRFLEEAQIMGQLEHPNIVPVHDLGEDTDGTRYFTMLYVRGKTLTDILSSETTEHGSHEAYYKLLQIFSKVCDAVAFAHSRGVVHRDLKPDNIMVGAFGEVYLMDWGIAKLLGRATPVPALLGASGGEVPEPVKIARDLNVDDEKGQIIGTFFYMSPEQAHARIDMIDERTDVFLLGGVLYEILTGQPPYMGNTVVDVVRSAQQCKVPQPELIAPERTIPTALTRIVMKCLAKEQRDRYPNALALKDDVELFLKGGMSFPTLSFKAGEHLMKEGDKGDQVFILKKGLVQVYKTYEDGRRHGLATLGPGAVVGEAAVLSAGERTASVVAVEDVLATAVTRTQLEKELGLNSWMGALVKALADRFLGVDDNLDTARGELAFLKIEHWMFEYFLAHGKPGPSGQREVELAKMVRHARRELKKSEAEIQRVLDGAPKIRTDAARDACWYQGL